MRGRLLPQFTSLAALSPAAAPPTIADPTLAAPANSVTGSTATLQLTVSSTIAVGTLVTLCVMCNSDPAGYTVTDTGGNTWTKRATNTFGTGKRSCFYDAVLTTQLVNPNTIDINPNGVNSSRLAIAYACVGPTQLSVLGTASTATSTTPSASITPGTANEVIFNLLCIENGDSDTTTYDTGAVGFSTPTVRNVNGIGRLAVSWLKVSSTSGVTVSNTTTSRPWSEQLTSYKP